jgi:hypothetical protein
VCDGRSEDDQHPIAAPRVVRWNVALLRGW